MQIRYGGEALWAAQEHRIGLDVAGVDTTIVVGVHLEADLLIGLDPMRYDPLPMGISIALFEDPEGHAVGLVTPRPEGQG